MNLDVLGLFDQWEILECNGHERSILCVKWPLLRSMWSIIHSSPYKNPCNFFFHDKFFGQSGLHFLVRSELGWSHNFLLKRDLRIQWSRAFNLLHVKWPFLIPMGMFQYYFGRICLAHRKRTHVGQPSTNKTWVLYSDIKLANVMAQRNICRLINNVMQESDREKIIIWPRRKKKLF